MEGCTGTLSSTQQACRLLVAGYYEGTVSIFLANVDHAASRLIFTLCTRRSTNEHDMFYNHHQIF